MPSPLKPPKRHSGFTLVELLIVVIILAILAAIVIPQFSGATKDTQEAALDSNLTALRSAIELYKAQHDTYPGAVATNGGGTCGGTKGALTVGGTSVAFTESMTLYTDRAGNTCNTPGTAYPLGPYIRKAIPLDPIANSNAVVVTSVGTPIAGGTAGGWAYDTKSGQIIVNSTANDSKSTPYSSH